MTAWLVALALLQGAPAPEPPRVQLGAAVRPETVAVGDAFRVIVRVRAARGATILFPAGPDSGGAVEALDPRAVRAEPDSAATTESAVYRLVAWDVGDQPIVLPDLVVRADGRERRVRLGRLRVFVRSVLPADSSQRVPKPARPIVEFGAPWWRWLLLAGALLALLGLLYWWWRRRRARQGAVVLDPYAYAEAEFARVEALGLVDAGERGRYVALMADVLRDFLARRIDAAHPSLTTGELLAAVRAHPVVPSGRLALVLAEADLVKFARRAVSADRARELGAEARAIVAAMRAEDARAAAAAAAQEKAA